MVAVKRLIFLLFIFIAATNLDGAVGSASKSSSANKLKVPLWETLLENELKKISQKNSTKPIAQLAKHPAFQIDPFQEKLVSQYGSRFIKNQIAEATPFTARLSSYYMSISREGMREWDSALTKYYKKLLKKDFQTRRDGIRATFNVALMVFDYLNYTGWAESQMLIREHLEKFEEALGEGTANALFCTDYISGRLYQFESPTSSPISINRAAVRAVANRNGELGTGLCSLCEMAAHNFEGFCDRGADEIFECLKKNEAIGPASDSSSPSESSASNVGGKSDGSAGSGGRGGTESSSGGGGGGKSTSSGGRGSGFDEEALQDYLSNEDKPDLSNLLHGMSENDLKLLACGLTPSGGMRGMLEGVGGNIPKGQCSTAEMMAAVPNRGRAGGSLGGTEMSCIFKFAPERSSYLGSPFVATESPMTATAYGCAISGRPGVLDGGVTTYTEEFENDSVIVSLTVEVDGDGDFRRVTQDPREVTRANPGGVISEHAGRLTDHNDESRTTSIVISNAIDQGNVRDHCTSTACDAQARALADEARRRNQIEQQQNQPASGSSANQPPSSNTPSGSGTGSGTGSTSTPGGSSGGSSPPPSGTPGDPGPEGIDTCTAEGRRAQATMDCVEGEMTAERLEALGGVNPEHPGRPLGPAINPGEKGVSTTIPNLDCFIGSNEGKNTTNAADKGGDMDRCRTGDDPNCYPASAGPGEQQIMLHRDGVIDPNPDADNDEQRCFLLSNGEEQCEEVPEGTGGGYTD